MPLQATSGAASYDAFGGGVAAEPNYIESCFSTYLYTGNGSTQTITNGIDLAGKGGLVWMKSRDQVAGHMLYDTASNATLRSDSTSANSGYYPTYINPTSSGFFLDASAGGGFNTNAINYASWTFRKQPKFFDVVTYTGNGTATNTISHNLQSVPGFIVVKCTSASGSRWVCAARDNSGNYVYLVLNSTLPSDASTVISNIATSTTFNPGYMGVYFDGYANTNGEQYVAYLFAHNAGGFGLTGTDNVISCGSFTTDGASQATVNLGYEPQWLLVKPSSGGGGSWLLVDNMRGLDANLGDQMLRPNSSAAESALGFFKINATGFTWSGADPSTTYIYIAIRRGPMKVPTSGTSVFNTIVRAGTGTATSVTGVGFPPDFMISHSTNVDTNNVGANDKLRGVPQFLATNTTGAEGTISGALVSLDQDGFSVGTTAAGPFNSSGQTNASWIFRRAPSFFDEVCYTGTGSARTVTHNLTVAPELMIFKQRDIGGWWMVYPVQLGNKYLVLQRTDAVANGFTGLWNNTAPTSSVFSLGTGSDVNQSGGTYVAYLFSTTAGVSKVGSYTGTATTLQVDCGFTGGARFVLIKRTDSTGDWYVWDSARGIVSGNDPYLLLNSTAAEVTSTDYVDTYSAGFEISSTAPAAINASGGSFIFLAIA